MSFNFFMLTNLALYQTLLDRLRHCECRLRACYDTCNNVVWCSTSHRLDHRLLVGHAFAALRPRWNIIWDHLGLGLVYRGLWLHKGCTWHFKGRRGILRLSLHCRRLRDFWFVMYYFVIYYFRFHHFFNMLTRIGGWYGWRWDWCILS